ncbi:unnamed protein product [Ectocarpus sp. CCAP 1310/34]|nr:unnamed protein product [Ectocarpus sp. CCAP 1310/34]
MISSVARTMACSKRKGTLLLCLVELVCYPADVGSSARQAFVNAGISSSSRNCCSQRVKHHQLKVSMRRTCGAASQASQGVFPSVARSPMPAGEIYEGEKKEKEKREQAEFNTNLGKVIDTLREDYPTMLDEPLNFDIYTPDLQLRDPSGVILTGLPAYKRMFGTFRFVRKTLVHDVSTVFRLSYDGSRQQDDEQLLVHPCEMQPWTGRNDWPSVIGSVGNNAPSSRGRVVRVTWHLVLDATPMVARPVHLDGTSVYGLSTEGLVRRHDLETIIVNGTPVKPPFAQAWMQLPSWVTQGRSGGVAGAPGMTSVSSSGGVRGEIDDFDRSGRRSGGKFERRIPMDLSGTAMAFQGLAEVRAASITRRRKGLLAAVGFDASSSRSSSGSNDGGGVMIWKASPQGAGGGSAESGKEGGASSSPPDGREGSDQDKDDTSSRGDTKKDERNLARDKKKKKKKKGMWPIDYKGPLACETSFDCTGGYVCCDLVVVKICCSNGVMQRKPGDLIPSLIPIPGRGRTELDQCQRQLTPQ